MGQIAAAIAVAGARASSYTVADMRGGTLPMTRIRARVTQLLVALNLTIGRMPRIVRWLDLLSQPSAARVIITRRRQLEYTELFSAEDRDGRRAAPLRRAGEDSPERTYRWTDTA